MRGEEQAFFGDDDMVGQGFIGINESHFVDIGFFVEVADDGVAGGFKFCVQYNDFLTVFKFHRYSLTIGGYFL